MPKKGNYKSTLKEQSQLNPESEISQGLKMKNLSMWQEESAIVPKSDIFSKWQQFELHPCSINPRAYVIGACFASFAGRETAAISAKQVNNTPISPIADRYTSDCRSQCIGRVSTGIPTDSVNRWSINSNNMSTSADRWSPYRPPYQPIVSTNTRPTDD